MQYPLGNPIGTLMANFLSTKDAQLLSVDDFHQSIVGGKYRAEVEAIVKAYKDDAKTIIKEKGKESEAALCDVLKKQLPYYVVQADVRSRRLLPYAKDFTGYVPVDIDHLSLEQVEQVMQRIRQLRWVKEGHRSSRGEGVHLLVAMGLIQSANQEEYKREYKRRYLAISEAVAKEVGVPVDGQCKDVLRGFFMSYDPDAFLRPDEEVVAFDYADEGNAIEAATPAVAPTKVATTASEAPAAQPSPSLVSLNPQLIRTYLTYNVTIRYPPYSS